MTMYEKRPTRWRDVPRHRDDVFLPILTPWGEGERKVAAVAEACDRASRDLGRRGRGRHPRVLFDVFRHKRTTRPSSRRSSRPWRSRWPTPANLTFCLPAHDPDYPIYSYEEILDCSEDGPGARGAAPPGDGAAQPVPVGPGADRGSRRSGEIGDDDFVVAFVPRNREVREFIRRVQGRASGAPAAGAARRRRAQPLAPRRPAGRRRRAVRASSRASSRWRSSRAS